MISQYFNNKIISITGVLLVFIATVSPADAGKNIKQWLNLIGIYKLPENRLIDRYVLYVGIFFILVSVSIYLWKAIKSDAWVRVWSFNAKGVGIFPYRRLISLSKGALIAYEKTHGTIASKWAERQPDGPLGWYAIYLIGQGEYPIYGIKPPLRRRMKIPTREIVGRGIPGDNGDTWSAWLDENPKYEKLAILKSDLKKRIRELKKFKIKE